MIGAILLAAALPQSAPPCGPAPYGSRAWVTPSDYPDEARREHMHGNVTFDLDVSAQGCPVACRVVKSSGYSLLDDTTCRLVMERARFSPPPAPVTWRKTMIWAE